MAKIYPDAIATAVKTASIVRRSPAILSPVNKSRKAFVRPIPGISVIIFPIMILSTLFIIPIFTEISAKTVAITTEINFEKILLPMVFSLNNIHKRTISPTAIDTIISTRPPPKNRVKAPAITE